jgi:peptide/nickel transport system substrate-binding protein
VKIVIPVVLITTILLIGCGSPKNDSKQQIASATSLSLDNDYTAIQKKAESFVPEIGTSGGEIVLSSFSDPKSFNPITSTEVTTTEFTSYMYEGLVTTNGVTLEPEAHLADSWETSSDGLTWVFHIRPGVIWSDSVPFSAYDVEFTFNELIYNNEINPNSSRDAFLIDGKKIIVTALDSSRVEFKLPFPYAPFLRSLSQEILPKHAYSKYVQKKSFSTELGIKTPPQDMVTIGPYILETFISSQKVVLKRNPNYWKTDAKGNKLPYIDRVVYMIVTDQNAELLKFKKGEVDYLSAKGEDYPSLKKDEAQSNYTVYRLGPTRKSSFLFFNQNIDVDPKTGKTYVDSVKLTWFRNVNFRKAVAHAIDKESMINIVMNGLGYPQWAALSPAEGTFFNPDVAQYPYDLAKAKKILADEGFVDRNNDGILEDKNGHTVEFSFVTNTGNIERGKIAEIIRKDLETIGFKVHFQPLEFNSLIQKTDNPPYDFDAVLLGLTGSIDPHFGINVWHSSGSLHMWYPRQKKPSTDWEAKTDSLFEAGVKELDIEKRKTIYNEWQRITAENLPLIYTVTSEQIYCIQNRFGNLNPSVAGGLLHNLIYMYIKKAQG